MSAFLSGEMKDTVQMNPAGAYGKWRTYFALRIFLEHAHQCWNASSPGRSAVNYSIVGLEVLVCGSRYVNGCFYFFRPVLNSSRVATPFGAIPHLLQTI